MTEFDVNLFMMATIVSIVIVSVLLIVHKINDDRKWRLLLFAAINDIVEYGDANDSLLEQFAVGWARRKHPDLLIYCPEDWRSVEDQVNEVLEIMKRDSLISRVEVFFVGTKFKLQVSAHNW